MKHKFKKILLSIVGVIAISLGAIAATAPVDFKTSIFGAPEHDGKKYTLYVTQCNRLIYGCTVQDRGEAYGTRECMRLASMVGKFEGLANPLLTMTFTKCKPFPELWKPL